MPGGVPGGVAGARLTAAAYADQAFNGRSAQKKR